MMVRKITIPVQMKLAALGIGSLLLVSACDNKPTLEERKEQARVQAQARAALATEKALQRLAKRHAAILPGRFGGMFYSLEVERKLGMQANRRIAVSARVLDIRRTARGGYVVEASGIELWRPELILRLSCTREQALAALRSLGESGEFGPDCHIVLTVGSVRKLILAVQSRHYGNCDDGSNDDGSNDIACELEISLENRYLPAQFILEGKLVAIEP